MKQKLILPVGLIFLLAMGLILTCSDDCPTCPKDSTPPLGHYRLYIWDAITLLLMSIDVPADTIVDSIRLDYGGYDLFIPPGGDRLLLTHFNDDSLYGVMEIYRTSDLSHLGTIDQYGDYFFDGHDNYGLWSSFKRLYFIDPTTLAPYDSLLLGIRDGYLDTVANLFFGSKLASDSNGKSIEGYVIYEVDCDNRTLVDSFVLETDAGQKIQPYSMAHNWRTGDFYFLGSTSSVSYFFQYDLGGDSVISATGVTAPFGAVAISPDGRSIYMTDGGDGSHFVRPPGYIWIFDAFTHMAKDMIPPYDFTEGQSILPYFGRIIPTADTRRLYVASNPNSFNLCRICEVDLLVNKIARRVPSFNGFYDDNIALGQVPDE
jgi:hypothetical protein